MKKPVKEEWKRMTELVHGKSFQKKQTCKVCRNSYKIENLKNTLDKLKYLHDNKLIWQSDLPFNGGIKGLFELDYFEWACDNCLENNKAITTNIDKQTYCDYPPYLAYYDKERKCEKCGENYLFKKSEQKYWYENLGFWVQSKPKHCKECRQGIKYKKDLNKELSILLKNGESDLNSKELFRIAEIYREIEKEDRVKKYTTLAEKKLNIEDK